MAADGAEVGPWPAWVAGMPAEPRDRCAVRARRRKTQGSRRKMADIVHRDARMRARRPLAAALTAVALLLAPAHSYAAYPERVITLIVPFPAGRSDRHHRPHRLGRLPEIARAVGDRRQSRRRGRQSRHGHRGARDARRLHAAAHLDRHRRQSGALQQSALRSAQGFRADLRARQRAQRALRARGLRHQVARRPDRTREGRARRRSTIRARAPAPNRISPPSSSSCAQASTWCTSRTAAADPRPWRCWKAPCRSARWRSRRSSR